MESGLFVGSSRYVTLHTFIFVQLRNRGAVLAEPFVNNSETARSLLLRTDSFGRRDFF